jgi:transcriptional antiterminator NusG
LLFESTVDVPHGDAARAKNAPQWLALWTRSHCEELVHDQLVGKGFETFLPAIKIWSRRQGTRRVISVPMFPGYGFLRHAMDKASYVEVLKTRGLVRILGERWDRLTPVPDREIEAIQRIVNTDLMVFPHPYLRTGQRVRVTHGPLADVEGILTHIKPNKGLLVLSVGLLQRSVSVEIDCTHVVPVETWLAAPGGFAPRHATALQQS